MTAYWKRWSHKQWILWGTVTPLLGIAVLFAAPYLGLPQLLQALVQLLAFSLVVFSIYMNGSAAMALDRRTRRTKENNSDD